MKSVFVTWSSVKDPLVTYVSGECTSFDVWYAQHVGPGSPVATPLDGEIS